MECIFDNMPKVADRSKIISPFNRHGGLMGPEGTLF